jgi:hypothetical protein
VYVAIVGPSYTAEQQAAVYRRFPEWSPQRHMFMDAPQRQAVRDRLQRPAAARLPCNPSPSRLQPCCVQAATPCRVIQAAALRAPGCNPMCARLQPHVRQVRDLLGLASTFDGGVTILPKLYCHIDRYWGFLQRGRIPLGLQSMPLPFGCPQVALSPNPKP